MNRVILSDIRAWKTEKGRKPLVIMGARQVGKSYLVRNLLAPDFEDFVEVNFEQRPALADCFAPDLLPNEILRRLEIQIGKRVFPGHTLLFFDEIQACPNALRSLRYFYEQLPSLHVIAAGSLIGFALEQMSVPVGRITFRYLAPLSFEEFLSNSGHQALLDALLEHSFDVPFSDVVHQKASSLLREYLAIGGMPEVVANFIETHDYLAAEALQSDLLETYQRDFSKYAQRRAEHRHVQVVFGAVPGLVGKQFKFSQISREIKSTHLRHAIDLLSKANVVHQVFSAKQAPLSATLNPKRYKLLFLDVGLMQRALGISMKRWVSADANRLVSEGPIAEQFVGQSLVAQSWRTRPQTYYWQRDKRGSSAEVDFLLQKENALTPVEVKAGAVGSLRSLRFYLQTHPEVSLGLRISTANVDRQEKLLSIPAYAFESWLRRH